MYKHVPLTWMRCLELISTGAGADANLVHITFDQVREIGATLDINTKGVEDMLRKSKLNLLIRIQIHIDNNNS